MDQQQLKKSGEYLYCIDCNHLLDLKKKKLEKCKIVVGDDKFTSCDECKSDRDVWMEKRRLAIDKEDQEWLAEHVRTLDEVDKNWTFGLGIQAAMHVGSSKPNLEGGGTTLRTMKVLEKKDEVVHVKATPSFATRVKANTATYTFGYQEYPRVFFMGWAYPFDQTEQIYRCEMCFEGIVKRPMDPFCYTHYCTVGDITLEEFERRGQSFGDPSNKCITCNAPLCVIQHKKDDLLRF